MNVQKDFECFVRFSNQDDHKFSLQRRLNRQIFLDLVIRKAYNRKLYLFRPEMRKEAQRTKDVLQLINGNVNHKISMFTKLP